MFRKLLVIPVLMVTLVACGGGSGNRSVSNIAAQSTPATDTSAPTPGASGTEASECPTSNTKAFAKTRFVTDAGLAFGAFHRYIYKPYKAGTFQAGASGRVKALAKAAAAGAFSINRLNAARKMVDASPLLCKTLKAPLAALAGSLGGLTGKLKAGNFSPSDIDSTNQQLESVRSQSGQAGAPITDQNARVPGT